MRTPNIGSIQYAPDDPPADLVGIQRHLRSEGIKQQAAINALAAGHIDMTTVAPDKPRNGDWRYADGTEWDPGSGKGVYLFNGTVWTLIAAIP